MMNQKGFQMSTQARYIRNGHKQRITFTEQNYKNNQTEHKRNWHTGSSILIMQSIETQRKNKYANYTVT